MLRRNSAQQEKPRRLAVLLPMSIARLIITCLIVIVSIGKVDFALTVSGAPTQSVSQATTSLTVEDTREAEERLSELGYWTGPVDGKLDEGSRHALIAFQKVEGRQRTGKLGPGELEALRAATRPKPIEGGFAHIELDLARQVLFVVDASWTVSKILPVSTGTGKLFTEGGRTRRAITPRGRFTVYRKINGWRRSPLGSLYYPSYIYGGIAIHGSPSVPPYPASQGCIRIPMFAARQFSEMTPIGTVVIIHDGAPVIDEAGGRDAGDRLQRQR
ncbi:MAG TPA: L,D-transpeptidase family protein [Blastocatellia bacterium]|nr:L,D-transpeptidase family protein [Blastocatellia bacterium]